MSYEIKKRVARRRRERLRGFAELVISSYYFNIVSLYIFLETVYGTLNCTHMHGFVLLLPILLQE